MKIFKEIISDLYKILGKLFYKLFELILFFILLPFAYIDSRLGVIASYCIFFKRYYKEVKWEVVQYLMLVRRGCKKYPSINFKLSKYTKKKSIYLYYQSWRNKHRKEIENENITI